MIAIDPQPQRRIDRVARVDPPISIAAANVTATIWDDSGNQLGTQSIMVDANGHTSFLLPTQLSVTAGKRGIVEMQSFAPWHRWLGLRFSPMGTFTSVPVIVSLCTTAPGLISCFE